MKLIELQSLTPMGIKSIELTYESYAELSEEVNPVRTHGIVIYPNSSSMEVLGIIVKIAQ